MAEPGGGRQGFQPRTDRGVKASVEIFDPVFGHEFSGLVTVRFACGREQMVNGFGD